MTPTPRAAVAWSTRKKQELIASFLLAEFDSLVVQARDCTEASATRINFFMITVAAAAAGLGAAGDLGLAAFVHLWLAFFACLFLLALGAITLWYSVRSAAQSMEMFRLAGRVRAWFANLAPEASPYFSFEPGDNQPQFTAHFWPMRGGEATVVAINSTMVVCLAAIAAYELFGSQLARWVPLVVLVAAVLVVAVWCLQLWLIKLGMRWTENLYRKRNAVHVPDTNHQWRLEDSKSE